MDIGNPIIESFNKNTVTRNVGGLHIIECKKGHWRVSSRDYDLAERRALFDEFLKWQARGVYDVPIDETLIKFGAQWRDKTINSLVEA